MTEGTVEERIQRRAESKLYLDKMVNRTGALVSVGGRLRVCVQK